MNIMKQEHRGRSFKREIRMLLESSDFEHKFNELLQLPKGRATHALISLLPGSNLVVKWRAVTAMGLVTADLANQDMESARAVMRRLIWSLYEESGGIGWGAPETLAEIMACHEGLAKEFVNILVSFVMLDGSFLEFEPLQCGVLWGFARLAQAQAPLLRSHNALEYVIPFFESNDPNVRGMAIWSAGLLDDGNNRQLFERFLHDQNEIPFFWDGRHSTVKVCDLAQKVLDNHYSKN